MTKIISVNAGSSSLKFKLFEMPEEKVITYGLAERVGLKEGVFSINVNGEKIEKTLPISNHQVAVDLLLNALVEYNIVEKINEIQAVGHRVVQGGSYFDKSVLVDDEVVDKVDELCGLAPLHNPANLLCYRAFKNALPNDVKHVFVFDTAFHQTMEADSYLFPVPYEWYTNYKVRRYGAHGTSHQFVAEKTAKLLNKKLEDCNTITCHLGNGASITAVKGGKSINTSMGLTPLGGIMMGTRCGDIDPTVVFFMQKQLNATPEDMDVLLNKKSGMLGVSGVSSDARDIQKGADNGDKRCILTQKLYVNRIINVIGGYFVQLKKLDAISFTAGVGENDVVLRRMILENLEDALGLSIDYELNSTVRGKEVCISKPDSKIAVFVVPTNEELVIARDTYNLAVK